MIPGPTNRFVHIPCSIRRNIFKKRTENGFICKNSPSGYYCLDGRILDEWTLASARSILGTAPSRIGTMEERPPSPADHRLVELILQAQRGSNEAWKELFEIVQTVVVHCRRHKRNFLERRLRDSDLVQEVAMKVSE